jgi:hypothetical protein
MSAVRVVLPFHLRNLAGVAGEVEVETVGPGPATVGSVLDALEARWPVLRGTMRDAQTQQRRPMVRFFACGEDWSMAGMDTELPAAVAEGREEFLVVGAIAGGVGRAPDCTA